MADLNHFLLCDAYSKVIFLIIWLFLLIHVRYVVIEINQPESPPFLCWTRNFIAISKTVAAQQFLVYLASEEMCCNISLSLSAQLLTGMLVKSRYPAHKSLLQAVRGANTMDLQPAAVHGYGCAEFCERHSLKVFQFVCKDMLKSIFLLIHKLIF